MITYEDALVKAKDLKPVIDTFEEREDAYIFGCKADDDYEGGLGHSPIVILKDSGETLYMVEYVARTCGVQF